MTAQTATFSIFSLCLHVAVFSLFSHTRPFEHGTASRTQSAPFTVSVSLIAGGSPSGIRLHEQQLSPDATPKANRLEEQPSEPIVNTTPAMQEIFPSDEYFSSGSLTHLPNPTAPIDLNVDEVSEVPFSGSVELTILIDVDGTVVDVVPTTDAENAADFIERVAARFKEARFTPGEINGRPVRSQFRITVVSEALPSSTN